jgi:hypothetical protein
MPGLGLVPDRGARPVRQRPRGGRAAGDGLRQGARGAAGPPAPDAWGHLPISLSDVSAAETAAATRQIKGIWLEGFLDGLEARFAEQVKASASMALMVAVHPVVKEAYRNLDLRRSTYRPQGTDVHNAAARAAGYKAGKEFSPSPTQRLASATPRLKQG